jgi:hypothetical protein
MRSAPKRHGGRAAAAAAMAAGVIISAPANAAAPPRAACLDDGRCFPTLELALAATHDGSVVRLGAGTFAGDVTIAHDIELAGAGRRRTVIRGGGPVLTVAASGRPAVSIHDLTISGGVTTASGRCATICGDGYADATALGGGIAVPPAADGSAGATVTVADAAITANRAAPATTVASVRSVCPNGPCRFGFAGGGGIDNAGDLTLIDSAVTANHAGGALNSDAEGGGILNEEPGTVTLRHTVVAGNHATASAPNGRFAEGGGIFAAGGTLTVDGGAIRRNTAALASALPSDVAQVAIAAGIHITEGASADIADASIDANRLTVSNSAGDALAFSAAIHGDGPVVVRRSSISHNSVTATTSIGSAHADAGAAELNAAGSTISASRLVGNRVTVHAPTGTADAAAGALVTAGFEAITISHSLLLDNAVTATSQTGEADGQGGGLSNIGILDLRNTPVAANAVTVDGAAGGAHGGGIWNGEAPDGPPLELALTTSPVVHNQLKAGVGLQASGGGLFTTTPVRLTRSPIAGNTPDQCAGC